MNTRPSDRETKEMCRLWGRLPYAEQMLLTMIARFLVKGRGA